MLDSDSQTDEVSLLAKSHVALRGMVPFGWQHRKLFLFGATAAIILVAIRLALPWPLRAVAEILPDLNAVDGMAAVSAEQITGLLLLFLAGVATLGLFDYLARLFFSRFAIATTRDLRQAAFVATLGIDANSRKAAAGDLVSRLIGDAGRVKAGVQGFLLHVATNGLLFIGVTVILFTIDVNMGLLFALAALATCLITVWGARRIFQLSLQHRNKEGQLANKIHTSLSKSHQKSKLKRINKSSGRYEASLTRLQGRVTWATHVVFGLATVGSLWVGTLGVVNHSIAAGDLVLFMFYALMIRGPIVRLARQGTRTGKILGPAYRLVQMLKPSAVAEGEAPALRLRSMKKKLVLMGVRLAGGSGVGPLDLAIRRGERIAIVDESGNSIRPLLEAIGGQRELDGGLIKWDSADLSGTNLRALLNQVLLVSPVSLLSGSISPLTQRFRQLATASRQRASVWLYLEPDEGLSPDDAATVLASLADAPSRGSLTTIVATRHPRGLEQYDRIVQIENGRMVFDGEPGDWRGLRQSPTVGFMPKRESTGQPDRTMKILFAGYAPVHFRCFYPLYRRLQERADVDVFVSGGLRSGNKGDYQYDAAAMYDGFDLPIEKVLPVEAIRDLDFDVQFSAHTKLILPRHVDRRIQIFHGVSFRNKAIRPENMACDHYFVIGPYMRRRFIETGLMQQDDPRIVDVGFMKTDALVDGTLQRTPILESLGLDGNRPVVLYAPTGAKQNSLETMGEDVIRELLAADKFDLLIKPHDHPKNKDIDWASYLRRYEGPHCRVIAPREDVIPMLFVADLLISDASSVVNEYTLLDRPILYLDTPELLEQARNARHSMLDLETHGREGGLVACNASEVPHLVAESLADPARLSAERRETANNLFFNQGHATDVAMAWMEQHVLPSGGLTKERYHAVVSS